VSDFLAVTPHKHQHGCSALSSTENGRLLNQQIHIVEIPHAHKWR